MAMFSGIRWYIFSALALLAAAAWIFASRAEPGSTTNGNIPLPRQGFAAPDFSLNTPDGQSISLSELRGRPVLVNLWTSWCPPCRAEMPAMQNAYEAYHDQGFEILAVNATNQDSQQDAIDFAGQYGLTFPILLDTSGEVSGLYQLRSLPTSFFIDRNGVIQDVVIGGPMSEALLRSRVQQLIEE
jgi:cytochrome c biogenesis protein CcmG/thiol:disulfide interchange protein DsbE